MEVRIRSALVRAMIEQRVTPELDKSMIVTRDLRRYYAILGHEHPWQRFSMDEKDAIVEALPRFRANRDNPDYSLARVFREVLLERGVDRTEADDAIARLVGLGPAQLIAVIDRLEAASEAGRRKALQPCANSMRDIWPDTAASRE
jgi:hypothetical protein